MRYYEIIVIKGHILSKWSCPERLRKAMENLSQDLGQDLNQVPCECKSVTLLPYKPSIQNSPYGKHEL
jgi:hypothetical protein